MNVNDAHGRLYRVEEMSYPEKQTRNWYKKKSTMFFLQSAAMMMQPVNLEKAVPEQLPASFDSNVEEGTYKRKLPILAKKGAPIWEIEKLMGLQSFSISGAAATSRKSATTNEVNLELTPASLPSSTSDNKGFNLRMVGHNQKRSATQETRVVRR